MAMEFRPPGARRQNPRLTGLGPSRDIKTETSWTEAKLSGQLLITPICLKSTNLHKSPTGFFTFRGTTFIKSY